MDFHKGSFLNHFKIKKQVQLQLLPCDGEANKLDKKETKY